jgi:hypothetical protein
MEDLIGVGRVRRQTIYKERYLTCVIAFVSLGYISYLLHIITFEYSDINYTFGISIGPLLQSFVNAAILSILGILGSTDPAQSDFTDFFCLGIIGLLFDEFFSVASYIKVAYLFT